MKRTKGCGPRPHTWVSGPDPVIHKKYRVWIQSKNQAQFRGEPWALSFEDFQAIWGDRWEHRGRTRGSLCMTRNDHLGIWDADNAIIITREEHAVRQAQLNLLRKNQDGITQ